MNVILIFKQAAYLVLVNKAEQDIYHGLYSRAISLLEAGKTRDEIEKQLLLVVDDIVLVTVAIKEARNAHYARLRKQGFTLVLIGCLTGLSGFLFTCINFNTSRSIDFAMYGLTTCGISIVFVGLVKIIG